MIGDPSIRNTLMKFLSCIVFPLAHFLIFFCFYCLIYHPERFCARNYSGSYGTYSVTCIVLTSVSIVDLDPH